jgi:hypothetical protein
MGDPDLAAHLRGLEETLLDPATRRDRGKVAALLADDFREFGSSGRAWSREATVELLASGDYLPPRIEDFSCHLIGEGVALVTYRSVRSQPPSQAFAVLRSSLWVKEAGGWRVRFHQGTPAESPVGKK